MSNPARDAILARRSTLLPVTVPGLDLTVHIRQVTVAEANRFQECPKPDRLANILILGVCDEQGEPLFNASDLPALSELPLALVNPIVEAFNQHNGFGEEGKAKAGNG